MGTHFAGSKEDTQALDTYIKLIRAAESVMSRVNRSSELEGLTVSQFGVLEAACRRAPSSNPGEPPANPRRRPGDAQRSFKCKATPRQRPNLGGYLIRGIGARPDCTRKYRQGQAARDLQSIEQRHQRAPDSA